MYSRWREHADKVIANVPGLAVGETRIREMRAGIARQRLTLPRFERSVKSSDFPFADILR
jgi:hypothetical protein